jgi:hypothetical protein
MKRPTPSFVFTSLALAALIRTAANPLARRQTTVQYS